MTNTTTREPVSIVADGHRLIRLPDVLDITGLSRSTIYRLERAGSFPRAICLSPKVRAHRRDEVLKWLEQRAADHRRVQDPHIAGAN